MTMQAETLAPVRKSITVEAPIERAFEVFTAGHDSWWPREHHIGKVEMAKAVMEPRTGGRYYEIGVDGSECEWGVVLECNPPHNIVWTWQLDGDFEFDDDVEHASHVEARFIAEGPTTTRVELEHRGFERHRVGGEHVREVVDNPNGWAMSLDRFADVVRA
jgi:uncharacterized protein YndB with AHSA1/START domain